MSSVRKPTLAFIGAGKVGQVLARLWFQSGYTVSAVHSRTLDHARALASAVDALPMTNPRDVVPTADLIFLTVPDDSIVSVSQLLASMNWKEKCAAHTSGVYGAEALSALSDHGARVGSLHPAYPFAGIDEAITGLRGSTFAVEAGDARLSDWLEGLALALDGHLLHIAPGSKALYHAAMVIASNYTVVLYAAAQRLLAHAGAEPEAARQALNALMAGTVDNLRSKGIPAALTGPLVRADVGTVRAHLAALRGVDHELARTYTQLARLAYPILRARAVNVDDLENFFRQDGDHAADYT